jgi:uncharacterized protein YndB with AHSA1/START domain
VAEASRGNVEPDIELTWTFNAPREEVWREWTEPERFADWYGGPQSEVPLETVSMDVRPGGKWRLVMHAGRGEIHWDGEYVEVEEPERLAFTVSDQPDEDLYDLCTVVLTDLGEDRTEMLFQQSGGHMPAAAYRRAAEGWSGFFERIAERLASDESRPGLPS